MAVKRGKEDRCDEKENGKVRCEVMVKKED
jgi:hypothetical protein